MIASRHATSQVWLITGSQSMYGQDILDQVADQSRQIAERLDASSEIPVEVRWLPVVTDPDQIARVFSAANTSDDCVGVITPLSKMRSIIRTSSADFRLSGMRAGATCSMMMLDSMIGTPSSTSRGNLPTGQ